MNKIKPKKLKKGNTIGIIGISGKIKEIEKIEKSKQYFEQNGYNVVISNTCRYSHRYMAGKNDDDCLNTLHAFFENNDIDVILCARGGFGTLRLLNNINWNIIKNNPKIFAGYSDITTLLNMIYRKTGLITFHSAMPNGDFSTEINEYTKNSFFNSLTGKQTNIKAEGGEIYHSGCSKGTLWGGNLSTLASLCGLDFIPDGDLILFIEDLNEPVYKIDKMLTQLFNIEKLRKQIKGIAIGSFLDIENKELLNEVLRELSEKYDIPARSGFKISHDKVKDTLPVGVNTELNADKGIINFLENYLI